VALGNKFAALQQDRGSLESKKAQAAEKAKAAKEGRKPAPPTQEQLADPKFYRTETLDRKPTKLDDGQWHHVLVEMRGNEAVAQVDGVVLRAKGTVFDAKKSRLVFLIGLSGTMLIDDVKVWENSALSAK
ncbi:MAG: LamG domain-containing protein, partial [Verrucomicrobiia bacterium]